MITGASRGIGLELTNRFLRSGSNVIGTCRNPRQATELTVDDTDYPAWIEAFEVNTIAPLACAS